MIKEDRATTEEKNSSKYHSKPNINPHDDHPRIAESVGRFTRTKIFTYDDDDDKNNNS